MEEMEALSEGISLLLVEPEVRTSSTWTPLSSCSFLQVLAFSLRIMASKSFTSRDVLSVLLSSAEWCFDILVFKALFGALGCDFAFESFVDSDAGFEAVLAFLFSDAPFVEGASGTLVLGVLPLTFDCFPIDVLGPFRTTLITFFVFFGRISFGKTESIKEVDFDASR